MIRPAKINMAAVKNLCRLALAEDIGSGDVTTITLIPENVHVVAQISTRQFCVVAGLPMVREIFHELDPSLNIVCLRQDGERCPADTTIVRISGAARAILTGERTALNVLQRLSGIATLTNAYVSELRGSTTKLLDTRKTTPCLRMLEKYAVRAGGGFNHRTGLYDQFMIKDNHLEVLSRIAPDGIREAVTACKSTCPKLAVEVEAESLEQVREALLAHADIILLDNMSTSEMREAVAMRSEIHARSQLEASGGITLERISEIRDLGLDYISVGALTHSATAIDIGLDLDDSVQS